MRLGIIGVGHLAGVIIRRLAETGWPVRDLIVPPRGRGAEMAARHGLRLVPDNATLVAEADAVLLAVRPADASEAVAGLPWEKRHILVSACAGVPLSRLAAAAGSAPRLMRIMPLTAAGLGASPTTAFPDLPEMRPMLERLGVVLPLASEADFEAATITAAVYGWAQELVRQTVAWLEVNGLDPAIARPLTAHTFAAAGRLTAESPLDLASLMASIATPGGITELGLNTLADKGVPAAWCAACDAVLTRLRTAERTTS